MWAKEPLPCDVEDVEGTAHLVSDVRKVIVERNTPQAGGGRNPNELQQGALERQHPQSPALRHDDQAVVGIAYRHTAWAGARASHAAKELAGWSERVDAIVGAISDIEHARVVGEAIDRAKVARRGAYLAKVIVQLKLCAEEGDPVVQQV